MQSAETILNVICERGRQGRPLERVYRQLFNPALYLLAYGRIYRNNGATTPGTTAETADGMSQKKIEAVIAALREEKFRWTPVRRVYIEKRGSSKKRPLGLPTWTDKLVQEVLRLILEAYFEPQFSKHSHGFRPNRGCHTALSEIQHNWHGTTWFIEGDIRACFDSLNHETLLSLLAEKIHDGRFLQLIRELLDAGYLEDWKHYSTLSGVPQGGVVSPILANIYLDRLDQFIETTLLPAHNRGTRRARNPEYDRLQWRTYRLEKQGRKVAARALRQQMQITPAYDTHDPDYRRLRFCRYADDFLLGFNGPREEAETIKQAIGAFLRETLKLELSEAKTLITHARSQAAHFLNYQVSVMHDDHKHDEKGRRSINGNIALRVPRDVIKQKCQRYQQGNKPTHCPERLNDTDFSIIEQFQAEYRGFVEYYRLAMNLGEFNTLRWVMEQSMAKTLANKHRISVGQVLQRYKRLVTTPEGPKKLFQVVIERGNEKKPLVAQWGGISLKRNPTAILNDAPPQVWNTSTELLERLTADTCDLCGSHDDIEVHHVRKLADLHKKGRAPKPQWAQVMIARRRKTLVVCRNCHMAIHSGRPVPVTHEQGNTGEPDAVKVARPVRRAADGKVQPDGQSCNSPAADPILRTASSEIKPAMGQGNPPHLDPAAAGSGQSRSSVQSGVTVSDTCRGASPAVTRKLAFQPEPAGFSRAE